MMGFLYNLASAKDPDILHFAVASYPANKMSLRLQWLRDSAPKVDKYPRFITVNLGNQDGDGKPYSERGPLPPFTAYLDVAREDFFEIKMKLEQQGLAKPYMRDGKPVVCKSGTWNYPLYQFDKEALSAMDPKGTYMYSQSYAMEARLLQMKKDATQAVMSGSKDFGDLFHF